MVQRLKNMKIERFEDIDAWQLARELARKVYRLTKKPRFVVDLKNYQTRKEAEPLNH